MITLTKYVLKRTRYGKFKPRFPDHVYLNQHDNSGPLFDAMLYNNQTYARSYVEVFDPDCGIEVKTIKITMEEVE